MLDEQTKLLLQIELNTISSSFPGLSCLVSELHRLGWSYMLTLTFPMISLSLYASVHVHSQRWSYKTKSLILTSGGDGTGPCSIIMEKLLGWIPGGSLPMLLWVVTQMPWPKLGSSSRTQGENCMIIMAIFFSFFFLGLHMWSSIH